MQQFTYAVLYVLLGFAALAYMAHHALKYPATWRALYRLIQRRPRLRPVKQGDHHDTAG